MTMNDKQAKELAAANAKAFDAFQQSIEQLMEKQHGKQVFNDALTNAHDAAHSSYLDAPEIKESEKELDELIRQIDASYVHAQTAAKEEAPQLLIPSVVYTPKPKEVVKDIVDQKAVKEQQKIQEILDKLPKNCTRATPNGTICPGGKCFNGKCKMTVPCYGDCCDDDGMPKLNYSPCANGVCSAGKCIELKKCYGECCGGIECYGCERILRSCEKGVRKGVIRWLS